MSKPSSGRGAFDLVSVRFDFRGEGIQETALRGDPEGKYDEDILNANLERVEQHTIIPALEISSPSKKRLTALHVISAIRARRLYQKSGGALYLFHS